MSNQASYFVAENKPLEVRDAVLPKAGPGQIVVKNHAVAVNPVDWKIQGANFFGLPLPMVLGEDVAGEVTAVGPDVSTFKVGDRVTAYPLSLSSRESEDGGFQLYTRISAAMASKIPDSLDFPSASALPLAISTAAHGLYDKAFLGLPHPSVSPKPTGQVILIWGASSSVGAMAVQLAKASGLEVIATASKHNHDFVRSIGADHIVDHTSSSAVADLVAAGKGKTFVGAYDAISYEDTVQKSAQVLAQSEGGKFVVATLEPPKELPAGTKSAQCLAFLIKDNEVGPAIWQNFLPAALANGSFKAVPEAHIVGKGLEHVQAGLDLSKKGVSAKKVVITL